MRNYILAVVFALVSSSAFAVSTCDTMPTKDQRTNCWSSYIGAEYQAADEYNFAVQSSKKVPQVIKSQVEARRQAIAAEANSACRKDELGYPDNQCLIQHIQRFKDYTYHMTVKFGVLDMRLD